jgi:sec-independent protein translocase protein TatA
MQRLVTLFALFAAVASAFAPPSAFVGTSGRPIIISSSTTFGDVHQPPALQRQRKSMASVQTMGLFGLGAPELVVIAIAAAFLLGPQKLAELGKDAGKIAGELKEVPREFQAGMAEGEKQAKAIKKEIVGESAATDADKE